MFSSSVSSSSSRLPAPAGVDLLLAAVDVDAGLGALVHDRRRAFFIASSGSRIGCSTSYSTSISASASSAISRVSAATAATGWPANRTCVSRDDVVRARGRLALEPAEVGAGHDRDHARVRLGLRGVEAGDRGVGVRAAQRARDQHAGQAVVGRELVGAGHLVDAVDARQRLADDLVVPFCWRTDGRSRTSDIRRTLLRAPAAAGSSVSAPGLVSASSLPSDDGLERA